MACPIINKITCEKINSYISSRRTRTKQIMTMCCNLMRHYHRAAERKNSPVYTFHADENVSKNLMNFKKNLKQKQNQSEGNIKAIDKSAQNKIAVPLARKSETNTSVSYDRDNVSFHNSKKINESVKLKFYKPNKSNQFQFQIKPSGLKHQFHISNTPPILLDLKNELLHTNRSDNGKKKKINIKPQKIQLRPKITQLKENDVDYISHIEKENSNDPLSSKRYQKLRSNLDDTEEETAETFDSENQPTLNQNEKEVVKAVHSERNSNKRLKIKIGERKETKDTINLSKRLSQKFTTIRKIPARNFFSTHKKGPSFRLKRDVISANLNEMYVRHNLHESPVILKNLQKESITATTEDVKRIDEPSPYLK